MDRLCRNIIISTFLISNLNILLCNRTVYGAVAKNRDNVESDRDYHKLLQIITLRLHLLDYHHQIIVILMKEKQHEKETISNLTINFRGHRTACNFSRFTVSMSGQKEVLISRGTSW